MTKFLSFRNEPLMFCAFLTILSCVFLLLSYVFGVLPSPDQTWLLMFVLTILATVLAGIISRTTMIKTVGKIGKAVFKAIFARNLPLVFTLIVLQTISSFTITATVTRFPLVWTYGEDSSIVGGEIDGNSNLTFVARSFPLNSTIFHLEEVVRITNRDLDPHSFTMHLDKEQTENLSRSLNFEVFIKTNDGRRFLALQIKNGTGTLEESIGFLIPSYTTWFLEMVSQGSDSQSDFLPSLKFWVRLWLDSRYAEGMTSEIFFI